MQSNDIAQYRAELGRIDIQDVSRFQIRTFSPRYEFSSTGRLEQRKSVDFRARIYAPDASDFELCYFFGHLPKKGYPKHYSHVFDFVHRPEPAPAEVGVILRAGLDPDFNGVLLLKVATRYAGENENSQVLMTKINPTGLPWLADSTQTMIDEEMTQANIPFELNEPVLLTKKYAVDKGGTRQGFMLWIQPRR